MKSLLLTVFLLLGMSWNLTAQVGNEQVIRIDKFNPGNFPKNAGVRYKSTFKVEIVNINPFLAKGEATYVPTTYEFEIGFQQILEFLKPLLPTVSSAMITSTDTNENVVTPIAVIDNEFPDNFFRFEAAAEKVKETATLRKELEAYINKEPFIADVSQFKKEIERYANLLSIDAIKENFLLLQSTYAPLVNSNSETKDYYLSNWQKAEKIYEELLSDSHRDKIYKDGREAFKIHQIAENSSYTYVGESHQALGDEILIKPVLKCCKEDTVLHRFPEFSVKTTHKLRVNISAGYLLSFVADHDYAELHENQEPVGVKQLEKELLSHSIGTLVHALYDFGTPVEYGLSTGLSYNNNKKINFFLGASAAFLQKNQLVLTAGVSFVNVKRLDTSNLDENLRFSTSDKEIKYLERYRPGPFIGLTYNLIKK